MVKQFIIPTIETIKKDMIANASILELELVWIPRIMVRQTREEVSIEATKEQNGVGLNGVDAGYITNLYKQITEDKRHLTIKQAAAARRILKKYAKQYVEIAAEGRANMAEC